MCKINGIAPSGDAHSVCVNFSYNAKVKVNHLYSSYKTYEMWVIYIYIYLFFVKATVLGIRFSSEPTVIYCFERGGSASECFCLASSWIAIETLPCRCLKALESKSCIASEQWRSWCQGKSNALPMLTKEGKYHRFCEFQFCLLDCTVR